MELLFKVRTRQLTKHTRTGAHAYTRKAADRYSKVTNTQRPNSDDGETHTCAEACIGKHKRTYTLAHGICAKRIVFAQFTRVIALDSNTNEWIRQCGRMYAAISRLQPTIDGWVQILYYTILYAYTHTQTHVHTSTLLLYCVRGFYRSEK